MELLQLKYFCDAAESENFSATAKKFCVPPSDISQCIKRLEKECGALLFARGANRIRLTEQGRRFYEKVSPALGMLEEARASIAGEAPVLRLCINSNRRIVMEAVEQYQKQFAKVQIKTAFFSDPTAEGFDLIISPADERLISFKKERLLTEQLAIAAQKESPVGRQSLLMPSTLRDEPFILMNEQSSLYRLTEQICGDFGFCPRITIQSDDPYYVRKCVELGLGVSLVPLFSWQGQFSKEITLHPLSGYTRDTFLYTDPKKHLPAAAQDFIDLLRKACREK